MTVNTEDMCTLGPNSGLLFVDTKYPEKDTVLEVKYRNQLQLCELTDIFNVFNLRSDFLISRKGNKLMKD